MISISASPDSSRTETDEDSRADERWWVDVYDSTHAHG